MKAIRADITTLHMDAIVNAANRSLMGGGVVDGAIHRAAGPELLEACRSLGGCEVGDAKITPGFRLPTRFVIHTVGPVWRGGNSGEADKLASCYRRSLEVARENGVKTLAFPAISTGVYGYPVEDAARIAVRTVAECLSEHGNEPSVTFCCFSDRDITVYRQVLEHDPMETMKHDPELIRHILEHAAHRTEDTAATEIPVPDTHSRTAMARHIALLIEHKLLEGHVGGPGRPHIVRALTSEGHDLLRALGDKGVREKIRHVATHLGEDVTIHIILDIARAFLFAL